LGGFDLIDDSFEKEKAGYSEEDVFLSERKVRVDRKLLICKKGYHISKLE
jgi:hypothetical protein